MQSVIIVSVTKNPIMLSVVMLNAIMLSVVMMSVMEPEKLHNFKHSNFFLQKRTLIPIFWIFISVIKLSTLSIPSLQKS